MEDFLGIGVAFPFVSSNDPLVNPTNKFSYFGTAAGDEKIRQSVKLILATAPGERVMRPDFGCGIHELLFEPMTPFLSGLVVDRVKTALARWEPRIDVLDVTARPAGTGAALLISITYRVRANNAVSNMVYPFYLQEGAA